MTDTLDVDHLKHWVGAEETQSDILTPSLVERFHATLALPGAVPEWGAPAPRLIHFCLCQPAAPMGALGEDGHPARGGFLPPVALPRRMWAGSNIAFEGDLLVGETVTRHSRIADVVVKEGRTGTLCFVTVDHEISGEGSIVARDRQTIVYRALEPAAAPARTIDPAPLGDTVVTLMATPPLLFRYSALTFNGHRIHYDTPYATGVEGYRGLVVHGPLQATMLLHLAARLHGGTPPDHFSFKSVSTLFDCDLVGLHAGKIEGGKLSLWTARPDGPVAMQAEASWA
ncbi:FAS1-like dehydratase domain-containing protein [Sphingobium sp. CCH11-B1]|uniref:FAS1-like dehydratase domain-containing protein n=1 Tax=Sphingobium sp. CCH11-B1 TaxID=1768781 RepID=UPI00082FD53F|nr:MaoC family dehydratase N-terminal domain-containing protein [Sphingobium sp. CCH11-B1]